MNAELKSAKQDIRKFIQHQYTDEKLASVYAFNQDKNMEFMNCCSCLMGVTLSDELHTRCNERISDLSNSKFSHYRKAQLLPFAWEAECSYARMGYKLGSVYGLMQWDLTTLRRIRLSAILRAEIRRRDRIKASQSTSQPTMVESKDELVLVKSH